MCIGTKIKKISAYAGSIMVIFTLIMAIVKIVGGQAIADNRVETMWEERTTKVEEIQEIKDCIADMKTDMAIIKNDTQWIKEHLKSQ